MENQLLCYFPYSSNGIAFESQPEQDNENQRLLSSDFEVTSFANKILEDVRNKKNIKAFINVNSQQIKFLSKKYEAPFKGLLHDDYKLDALLKVNGSSDTIKIEDDLKQNGIKFKYSLFQEKNYLVIPNVNEEEVHENIHKIM